MTASLSPVEALQREIERLEGSSYIRADFSVNVLFGALELAKAVAEREALCPTQVVLRLRELSKVLQQ